MASAHFSKRILASMSTFVLVAALLFPAGFFSVVPLTKAATYTVNNLNDGGAGSFRQAILDANGNPGADIINFEAALNGTVNLVSTLPVIDGPVTINAQQATNFTINTTGETNALRYTAGATGSMVKGLTVVGGGAPDGIYIEAGADVTVGGTAAGDGVVISGVAGPAVRVFGSATVLGSVFNANNIGIMLNGATSTEIGDGTVAGRNLIYSNNNDGIDVQGASSGFTINNNYIGTSDGTADNGNGNSGISIIGAANGGVISTNLISGNTQNGIVVRAGTHTIQGNTIGLTAAGADLGNDLAGILIETTGNTIGGAGGLRNIISGNGQAGIRVDGNANPATGNIIQYNYIGTNLNGTAAVPNATGVLVTGANADDTVIQYNVISGNSNKGAELQTGADSNDLFGNYFGLSAAGDADLGNTGAGLEVRSDNNQIGDNTDGAKANYFAGNGTNGLWIAGGDSNIVERNVFGLASDGTTPIVNDQTTILIDMGAQNNLIGGTDDNAANTILSKAAQAGVTIGVNAGNGNGVRRNNFDRTNLYFFITRSGTSNESIATPTITSVTQGRIVGTGLAGATIEVYGNGPYKATATIDGNGDFDIAVPFLGTVNAFAAQTTVGGSTSGITLASPIAADAEAPSTPTVTSHSEGAYVNVAAQTLSGAKEAYSSIEIGGMEEVAHNASATWSYAATLVEGLNTYSIVNEDGAGNKSSALVFNINLDTVTPSAPTVSNPGSVGLPSYGFSISGTEGNSNIIVDGTDTGVDTDASGNATVTLNLSEGSNTFSFQIQDRAGNTSGATSITITREVSTIGVGGGGSGGGSSSSSSSNNTNSSTDTTTPDDKTIGTEPETIDPVVDPVEPVEPVQPIGEPVEPIQPVDEPEQPVQPSQPITPIQPIYVPPVNITVGPTVIEPILIPQETAPKEILTVKNFLTPVIGEVPQDQAKPIVEPEKVLLYFESFQEKNLLAPEIIENLPSDEEDQDGDGISDKLEVMIGMDPNSDDSDRDGIKDIDEINEGLSPTEWDSDGDKIADNLDANPLDYDFRIIGNINPDPIDTDGDGLTDDQEVRDGTNPEVADTDGDGIDDGDELLNYGTNPNAVTTKEELQTPAITENTNQIRHAGGSDAITVKGVPEEELIMYIIDEEGNIVEIGRTVIDEFGKGLIHIEGLDAGEHDVFVGTNDKDGKLLSFSATKTIKVTDTPSPYFEGLNVQLTPPSTEDADVSEARVDDQGSFELTLPTTNRQIEIIYHFQSAVLSQTLIADASGQTLALKPTEPLEPGNHTLTIAAVDPESNERSEAMEIQFYVDASTTAFVSGQSSETGRPWMMVGGAIVFLAGLTALAVFLRKRKTS